MDDEENFSQDLYEEEAEETQEDDYSDDGTEGYAKAEYVKQNKIFIFKSDQKKVGNNYFPNDYVTNLILEYQKTMKVTDDKIIGDKRLEYKIMAELEKLALAIINKYCYWKHCSEKYCSMDDLMQECLKVAFQNIPKFNAEYIVDEETKKKTSAFNFFSLIFKMHLLSFTVKGKKNRGTADVDEFYDVVEERTSVNYDMFFMDLEKTLFRVINENYVKQKRKKYLDLASILLDYLVKTKAFVGKNDLLSWVRGYGYKTNDFKEFTNEMQKYKELIYSIV